MTGCRRRLAAALAACAALAGGAAVRAEPPARADAPAVVAPAERGEPPSVVAPPERADAPAAVAAPAPADAPPAVAPPARNEPPTDCPPTPTPPTEDELRALHQDARDRGYLWRIVKDERASYVYGTIHVARRDWALPGPTVSRALNAVDTVALELDPLDPAIQAGLAQGVASMRRPGLPATLDARLAAQARADCLPDAPFAVMAPSVKAMVLTTVVGRRDGFDPAYGIDNLLAAFGHARKLEVVSLETPALQLTVLDMGSDDATVAWVDNTLAGVERGVARAQLAALARAWADGDLAAMTPCADAADCAATGPDGAMRRRVLDDRNPTLAAGIDALHTAGKRVFAAVGSLHMVGPLGVPALLAARGYRVERVRFESP